MSNELKAILVIDMQEDYIGKKKGGRYNSYELIKNINEHIIEASQNGDLIIYIKNKRINKRGEHVSELVTGLKIVSDYIVEKDSKSVFSNDKLESILKDNNIETIEVNGIDGCCCVAATALDAVEKGYNVIFPLKYIGTLNEERFITKIRSKLLKSEINII